MKKLFAMLAALLLLSIIACGGGNDAATSESGISAINSRNEVSDTITASGGTIESTDPESKMFHAKIVIPQGALDKDTVISLTKIDQVVALPDDIIEGGVIIEFGPDGTVFNKNIVITIPYDDADNDGIVDYTDIPEDQLSVIYWDSSAKQWTNVDSITSRDTINNTITFETDHFSKYTTSGPKGILNNKVLIFTIDGLDFERTYNGLLKGIDYPDRTGYLKKGILESGFFVKKGDIYSFGGTNPDEAWEGDASQTSDYIPELIIMLKEKAKEASDQGKKFIVVTHSWGTQLGTIGLSMSGVEPDLFITLSDPEGSKYVDSKSYSNYFFIMFPLPVPVTDAEELVDDFVKGYGVGVLPPTNIKTKKWINYWDVGDLISGPLGPLTSNNVSNSIENEQFSYGTSTRDYNITKKTHAITSLSEASWKDNGISNEIGNAFRNRVLDDINKVIQSIYSISGRITCNGYGLSSVTVTLTGTGSLSTLTDENGWFTFVNAANGNYTLRFSVSGYTFSPSSVAVEINGANFTVETDIVANASH